MTNLNDYFDPVSIDSPEFTNMTGQSGFPHNITIHTESSGLKDLDKYKIAIFGVPEGRNSPNIGSFKAPDAIRGQLYMLTKIPGKNKLIDLGNMKRGTTFRDTVAGLTDILVTLLNENIFPVVVGGSSALSIAFDQALSLINLKYTLLTVDARIDYSNEKRDPDSYNYLNTLVHNHKSTLGHFINIGYQTYLNDPQVVNRFLKRRSELIRIGDVRKAIYLTEPLFRDSEAAVFDISSVRHSDAPGTISPSPNGFYGEEICLLARYAGISDRLRLFGLFEVNPEYDARFQTAGLAAQILWFFLEGFSQKQYETPVLSASNAGRFVRYHVHVTDLTDDLIFVKSNLTDRWWMEFPAGGDKNIYIACSHEDYMKANRNEVPERWMQGAERLKY